MLCFTCVLDVSLCFYLHFGYQHKNNARKLGIAKKKEDNFSILHCALGKNVSQLHFSCILDRLRLPKRKPNAYCDMALDYTGNCPISLTA